MSEVLSKISYTEIIKEALRYEPAASQSRRDLAHGKMKIRLRCLCLTDENQEKICWLYTFSNITNRRPKYKMCGPTAALLWAGRAKTYRIFLLLIGIWKTLQHLLEQDVCLPHSPTKWNDVSYLMYWRIFRWKKDVYEIHAGCNWKNISG